jgi:flagellar hook protein FlgE
MAADSMFIGVSGLEAYQNQIDVVSNNIANVGTTGYKGQDVNFQDLIYQNQTYATAPTQTTGGVNGQQVGLGVKIGSIDTNFTQGGLQTTGVNTNLAMNGDGFFILRQPNGSSAPVYTRNGDFSLNANGLLYDPSSGMAVQGYLAGKNGQITQTGTPGDITIPLGLKSQAVGTGLNPGMKFGATGDSVFDVSLGGNLDQTQWIKEAQGAQAGTVGTGQPYITSTTIYDSLGNGHLAQITYTPDASGATAGTGAIITNSTLAAGGGAQLITSVNAANATSTGTITVTLNAAGTVATLTEGGSSITGTPGSTVTINGTKVTLGTFTAADGAAAASGTITTTAAVSGLPGDVADANGQLRTVASRWKVSVSFADGTQFSSISAPGNGATAPTYANASSGTVGYAYFDQNGQYVNTSSYVDGTAPAAGQPTVLSGATVHAANQGSAIATGDQLNIVSWGTGNTNNSTAPTAGGPTPATGPIGLDFHQTTSLAATASANVLAQNGFGAGILDNMTIGQDGTITGAFTNGQTQVLGRVAVATFQNENGLQRIGGSDFAQTANSGLAQVGTAGVGRLGSIVSGSLEQSNVSIADQFAKMIAAQNAYQANSKSITVASEDLQTVTGLIR